MDTESASSNTSNLLTIPAEVIYEHVLPNLRPNELLHFRRTCKHIKLLCDAYIRSHCRIEREVEINEDSCTFDDILALDFPVQRVYLNNIDRLFEHPRMSQFLEHYATEITHLSVENYSVCISEPENNFYLSLTNLQHLVLNHVDLTHKRCFAVEGKKVHPPGCFPVTFKNLKTLKLGKGQIPDERNLGYCWDFIMKYYSELGNSGKSSWAIIVLCFLSYCLNFLCFD